MNMTNFSLVSALIRGEWAIEEQFAENSLELVTQILAGTFIVPQADHKVPEMVTGAGPAGSSRQKSSANQVMVIPVTGALMKNDGACGVMGMGTMAEYVKQANRDPNVAGMVLAIDSPGGTVDGTENLANTIKASNKPIVSWVNGQAASAALWIASAAGKVIASSPNDEVGCIGVMSRLVDNQPKMEKEGVRIHTLVSAQTPDKNRLTLEVVGGKYDNYMNERLNPLGQIFIDAVTNNRPGIDPSYLTGKMYFAKDAMGSFVDRIGSMEDAIDTVMELSQTMGNSNTTIAMNQFERINAVLGVESLESVDGSVNLNEEQLNSLESALGTTGGDDTALQGQLDAVQAGLAETQIALENANAALTAEQARTAELVARISELEDEPGADGAPLIKKTDGGLTAEEGLTQNDMDLFNLIKR